MKVLKWPSREHTGSHPGEPNGHECTHRQIHKVRFFHPNFPLTIAPRPHLSPYSNPPPPTTLYDPFRACCKSSSVNCLCTPVFATDPVIAACATSLT